MRSIRRILLSLSLLAAAFSQTACSSLGDYARDRACDLLDVVKLKAGAGVGLEADVQATDLIHLGAGASFLYCGGISRRAVGYGVDVNVNPPIPQIKPDIFKKPVEMFDIRTGDASGYLITRIHQEGTVSLWDEKARYTEGEWCELSPVIKGGTKIRKGDWSSTEYQSVGFLDLEVGVTLGVVGVRVGFSPGELLDFILGLFGLDIAGDDRGSALPPGEGAKAGESLPFRDP